MKKSWHQNFKRANKAARTTPDGVVFDSRGEMVRWKHLQLWQLAGDIRNLRRQVRYELIIPGCGAAHTDFNGLTPRHVLTKTGKTMIYTADFVYEKRQLLGGAMSGLPHAWREVIEDYKGYHGRVEQLRIAVFEAIYGKKVTLTGGRK